jgi:hypothetical protein
VSTPEVVERLDAQRAGTPFLLYRDGERRQRVIELRDASRPLSIGRAPSCAVALDWDDEVSRVHAELECLGDAWTLADDGLSRNGTFVNGERLRGRRRLADGDRITAGRTLLVFSAGSEPQQRPTTPAGAGGTPELSAAQLRVLVALCRPMAADPFAGPPSNREIADELVVSVETVKSHMQKLFERFGLGSVPPRRKRAELVRRALEAGIVPS